MNEADRFWAKVEKTDECWIWNASRNALGYGNFSASGRITELAHRTAWRLYHGPIAASLLVCHKCDNPSCVRPDHLFLGTSKDNTKDQIAKMRRHVTAGTANGRAKLTASQVTEIRQLYSAGGITQADLAFRYNVGRTQISNIVLGREWRQIPDAPL